MGEFRMPSLCADMEAGTLVEWMVKPGDRVSRGDIIATVETQKGLFEVENYENGVMQELLVQPGRRYRWERCWQHSPPKGRLALSHQPRQGQP